MANAKKLPSGSWRVRVTDPMTGKLLSFTSTDKTLKGKRDVEAEAAVYVANARYELEHIRFKYLCEEYIESKVPVLSPTTIAGYRNILKNYMSELGEIHAEDITPRVVQNWINGLTASKSPKTVHNAYGLFTAVAAYHDMDLSLGKIRLPKKQRKFKELPTEEVVLKAFKDSDIELPVLLAVWCGLRMSEILGIRKCDIKDGVLTINQVVVTVENKEYTKSSAKTYKSKRQMRLPPPIMALIDRLDTGSCDRIEQRKHYQIADRFRTVMHSLGYTVTFHDLRHINASVMAALGIPDLYAMERGGWSSTTTLRQVYQQTFTTERVKVDNIIDCHFQRLYDDTDTTKIDTAI